MHLY
jgi:hypothetical protein